MCHTHAQTLRSEISPSARNIQFDKTNKQKCIFSFLTKESVIRSGPSMLFDSRQRPRWMCVSGIFLRNQFILRFFATKFFNGKYPKQKQKMNSIVVIVIYLQIQFQFQFDIDTQQTNTKSFANLPLKTNRTKMKPKRKWKLTSQYIYEVSTD